MNVMVFIQTFLLKPQLVEKKTKFIWISVFFIFFQIIYITINFYVLYGRDDKQVLRFQYFPSLPWSKSALTKQKLTVRTFRCGGGVSLIRRVQSGKYLITQQDYKIYSALKIQFQNFFFSFSDFPEYSMVYAIPNIKV